MPTIQFEKPVVLSRGQRFADKSVAVRSGELFVDFGYPFVLDGKVCSGFDAKPCQLPVRFTSAKGHFTRADLARLVRKKYIDLFRSDRHEAFHRPEDLVIEGMEKKGRAKLWRLNVSS